MPFSDYSDVSTLELIAGQQFKQVVGGNPLTYINGGTVVLAAGFGAVFGSTEGEVILPSGAGTFAGLITLPQTLEKRTSYSLDAGGRFGYPVDYEVALAMADMWAVYVDDTVAQGDPVYLNHTASTSVIGAFRNDANSSNAQLISGARFETAAVGTNLALAVAVVNFSAPTA